MDKTTVFSKSGKGLLEIKSKSNRLSKDEFRVLNLVDGRVSLQDLVDKSRIAFPDLRKILGVLADGGFIKELTTAGGMPVAAQTPRPGAAADGGVDDLDFTQLLGPAKLSKPGGAEPRPPSAPAERKGSEPDASNAREEAARAARDEAERRAREKLETENRAKQEAERKAREEAEKRAKEEVERRVREKLDAEARAKEEAEREAREEGKKKNRAGGQRRGRERD